jgi:hypothetical protein
MHHYLKHVENSIDPELVVARIASERGEGIWRKHFRKQDVLPKHIRSTLRNLGDSK